MFSRSNSCIIPTKVAAILLHVQTGDTVFLWSALFGTAQYDLIGVSQGNPSPFEVQ